MNTVWAVALLAALFALGFGVMSYKGQARARGWPIGEWFDADGSWINILSLVSWISASIMAFRWLHWTIALMTIFLGVAGAFLLTNVFKTYFQCLALFMIPLFIAAWWFLGIL